MLYLEMISRTALTSASTAGESCAARAVRRWEMSQATDHWQRCSRNRSFQHSCSSSTCAGGQSDSARGGRCYHTSASKSSIRRFVITEKDLTRTFSWLKTATTALLGP